MEDPDWIEIAYVFEQFPSKERLLALFDVFPEVPGPEYDAGEFDITSWNSDGKRDHDYGNSNEAIDALEASPVCSVEVPFDEFQLVISSDESEPLLESTPHLTFRENIYPFSSGNEESTSEVIENRRAAFMDTLTDIASILEPKWGFGRRGGLAIGEDETVAELASRQKPPLYDYNVFNPEKVEAIGRDRLASVPAYHSVDLDFGGVFLVVLEPTDTCWEGSERCQEVADHLGLELGATERYR